jgi:branched-chain amino acid transport system substrate-binding protein
MTRYRERRLRVLPIAVALSLGLLAGGCGTRVSHDEVLAGAGSETVALDPSTIAALRQPAQNSGVPSESVAPQAGSSAGQPAKGHALSGIPAGAGAPVPAMHTNAQPASAPSENQPTARPPDATKSTSGIAHSSPKGVTPACTGHEVPIAVGQVGHFSGVLGPLTAGARTGLAVWAQAVNAQGGVVCHRIELYSVDDGTDPARTSAAVGQLVNDKHVVALVAAFSPISAAALKQSAEQYRIPVVGGDGAALQWNQSPYLFPQGASLITRIYMAIHQPVEAGLKRMGLLYCVENTTCTTLDKLVEKDGLGKQAGTDIVYSAPVSLAQPDYTAQCQNAKNAGADVLGVAMDGSAISRLIRSCGAIGYRPAIATDSLLISAGQAADPGLRRNGVYSTNIDAPWMLSDTPGQRAYQSAMHTYAPQFALDGASILAWTSGKLFEAALAHIPHAGAEIPTSATVESGLGRIHNETLDGLTPPLTFLAGKPAPQTRCLYYTRLDQRGWTAPRKSTPVCY